MTALQRSSDVQEIRLGDFDVIAAGAIPWRIAQGKLEVLLIHRPRYDDWSWPKGKLDAGESVAECAVREVREEVGLDIRLGIPLAATAYSVKGKAKVVYYWATKVDGSTMVNPDGGECDLARWVTPASAMTLLTNPSDIAPLEDLFKAYKKDRLHTHPFIILRHAKAKPRGKWTRAEGERPLAATGRRQAQAVARLLDAWNPRYVSSSPWMRCVQTVAPYLTFHNLKLKTLRALTESAATRRPEKAMRALDKLMDKGHSQVVCTHRPVLPILYKTLNRRLSNKLRDSLPAKDPYLEPGGIIVLHLPAGSRDNFVSVEIHNPYHD